MNWRILPKLAICGVLLVPSPCAYSLEKLKSFPGALIGAWIYETGNEKLDGCKTSRILVNNSVITLVQECIYEGRSVSRYRVKDVLVDRTFFSNKIQEYHVLTDGPNVVFDSLKDYGRSTIYLQFWVTDDYGPTRKLGVFNLQVR